MRSFGRKAASLERGESLLAIAHRVGVALKFGALALRVLKLA